MSALREVIPTANIIALLVNPTSPFITENISKDLQSAARTLGLQLHIMNASTLRLVKNGSPPITSAAAANSRNS